MNIQIVSNLCLLYKELQWMTWIHAFLHMNKHILHDIFLEIYLLDQKESTFIILIEMFKTLPQEMGPICTLVG